MSLKPNTKYVDQCINPLIPQYASPFPSFASQYFKYSRITQPQFSLRILIEEGWYKRKGLIKLFNMRMIHYPLQYIAGQWPFLSITLKLGPGVFIPRQETQHYIRDSILPYIPINQEPFRVIDLCCGSGAIGLAIAKERPNVYLTLVDKATNIKNIVEANRNINKIESHRCTVSSNGLCQKGVGKQISVQKRQLQSFQKFISISIKFESKLQFQFIQACMLQMVAKLGEYDLVVCNPPYLSSALPIPPQVRLHQPASALFANDNGLFYVTRICQAWLQYGKGRLVVEYGGQTLSNPIIEAAVVKDAYGRRRFIDLSKNIQ